MTLYYRSWCNVGFFSKGNLGFFFPTNFLTLGHKIPRDSPTFWIPKVLLPAVGIVHMDFRLKSTVPDFFAKKPGKNPKGWDFLWKGRGFMKWWPYGSWCIMGPMANALLEVWSTLRPIIMKVNNCTPGTAVAGIFVYPSGDFVVQSVWLLTGESIIDHDDCTAPPRKRSSGSLEMYKVCISL